MALNWDEIRKGVAYTGGEIPVPTKAKATAKASSAVPVKRVLGTGKSKYLPDRKAYLPTTRQGYEEALKTNAGARFHAGAMEGLSPLSYKPGIETQYGADTLDALQNSKAYTAGQIAGTVGQFATGYGAAAPKISSLLAKAPAFAKAGKIGQGVMRSVATDLAVGFPLNTNIAYNKEGLQGDDALKNIALNTAIDLVAGGVLEVLPSAVKGIKKLVNKRTKEVVAEVPEEFAEAIAKGTDTTGGMPEVKAPQDMPTQGSPATAQRVSPQSDTIVPLAEKVAQTGDFTNNNTAYFDSLGVKVKDNSLGKGLDYGIADHLEAINKAGYKSIQSMSALASDYINAPTRFSRDGYIAFMKSANDSQRQNKIILAAKKAGLAVDTNSDIFFQPAITVRTGIAKDGTYFTDIVKAANNEANVKMGKVFTKDDYTYEETLKWLDIREKAKKRLISEHGGGVETDEEILAMWNKFANELSENTPPKQAENIKQRDGMVDLGADLAMPIKQTDQLIDEYGAFPQGMQPAVDGRPIPKATDMGEVQQGMRTIAEAPAISEESYKEILSVIEEGAAWKPIIANETVVNKANALIASEGLEASYGRFSSVLADGKQARSEDIALGYRLMQEYQAKKDFAKVANIAVDVSEMLSQSGRSLQASSIIKALSPEGRLMAVQRVAKRLSEQHDVRIDLDEETIAKIFGAKTEKEIFEAQHEAVVKMWSMIPPGLLNRINAWRYMAMLTNPKTHVRNILGNAIFLPAREVKNLVGAGLEKAAKVPVGQRTKAVINPFNASDQALISFADKHFAEVLPIMGGTRLDDVARPLDAAVFSKKWEAPVEAVRKGNLAFMTATDDAFKRIAWDSSFAQYMKANKLTPDTITAKQILAGREYAVNEALKATYQDASTLSKAIARLKSNLSTKKGATPQATLAKQLGSFALEGLIPFSKTPINLVRRGFEYSPVGLMGSVADVISAARKGKGMAAALDKMAAGLTGTGVMALGAWLGKSGIVVGGSDEAYNSKLSQFDRATGMQEYAIDTGDGTYTIDWAAPMSMPFFVGVEIAKGLDSEGLASVLEAMTSIDEPVMNLSMLKGINDALRTYSQEDSALGQIATNMMISYLGQFVPTIGGQLARTLDDTRRTTTSTDESALVRKLEKAGKAQLGKVPFANQSLEPYINLWGETESSGTAFGNFINPGYYKEKSTSRLDGEIRRVAEAAGEEGAKAIPRLISGYTLTADKQSYRLTEKELTKFKQIQGQESKKGAEKLIRSAEYKRMSDEDKAKALDKVYSEAFQTAKWTILKQRSVFPVSDKKTTRF